MPEFEIRKFYFKKRRYLKVNYEELTEEIFVNLIQ